MIQLGATLAVLILFFDRVWPFGRRNNRHPLAERGALSWVKLDKIEMWFKIVIACVPAVVVGVLFDDVLDGSVLRPDVRGGHADPGGRGVHPGGKPAPGPHPAIRSIDALDYRTAAIIGLFQLLAAIFPGTSRSGATIVGALMLGVSRTVAVEFTFYLAIPVMFGASLLKIVKFDDALAVNEWAILITGMLVACAVSLLVIRRLLNYVRRHSFKPFGWYRIALGVAVLAYLPDRSDRTDNDGRRRLAMTPVDATMPNWTDEQLRAIEARGGSILLSAAAGSGKTTVLVERVLRLIAEEGADVDRMLVVTFTRAAASDMRAKLSRRLNERAAMGDARCREQLMRLDRASISTLHAFCADFLRTNFESAGVDPAFRILDDAVAARLRDEALDEALEEAYAGAMPREAEDDAHPGGPAGAGLWPRARGRARRGGGAV